MPSSKTATADLIFDDMGRPWERVVILAPVFIEPGPKRGSWRWRKQKRRALVRDNFTCQRCGHNMFHNLTVHHIIPRAAGGLDNLNNLETLCRHCHQKEHAD